MRPLALRFARWTIAAIGLALFASPGLRSAAFAQTLCEPAPTALCLADGRFRVTAVWNTDTGSGIARAVSTTGSSGYFTFFGADSPEVVVKAVDGCAFNGRFWIFSAGMTNVGVTLTVLDARTVLYRTYFNPPGTTYVTVTDTNAFPACPENLPCADPAPLYGEFNALAPGYIVQFRPGTNAVETAHALAAKYGFTLRYVWDVALLGFSAEMTPETVAALRCEPSILSISYETLVFPASGPARPRG